MSAPTPTPIDPEPSSALQIRAPAVQRCTDARERSLQDSRAKKLSNFETKERADLAYQAAMPNLSGYENIRDFIACVSYGTIAGGVHPIESTRLLYSAQVAISALRLAPKDKKTPPPYPQVTVPSEKVTHNNTNYSK